VLEPVDSQLPNSPITNSSWFNFIFRFSALGLDDFTGRLELARRRNEEVTLGEGENYQVFKTEAEILHLQEEGKLSEPILVAVKRLRAELPFGKWAQEDTGQQNRLRSMLREIHTMTSLRSHDEIVTLYGIGHDLSITDAIGSPDKYVPYLVVELAPHRSLRDFLSINNIDDQHLLNADFIQKHFQSVFGHRAYNIRKSLCVDAARGLNALHMHGIFHTDVKVDNVLVYGSAEEGYRAKITDFGAVLIKNPNAKGDRFPLARDFGGTKLYSAPELNGVAHIADFSDAGIRKCDIFSYGLLLLEATTSCQYKQSSIIGNNGKSSGRIGWMLEAIRAAASVNDYIDEQEANILCSVISMSVSDPDIRPESIGQVLSVLLGDERNTSSCISCSQFEDAETGFAFDILFPKQGPQVDTTDFTNPMHDEYKNVSVVRLLSSPLYPLLQIYLLGNTVLHDRTSRLL
jgi:serine/threonine protein kinase